MLNRGTTRIPGASTVSRVAHPDHLLHQISQTRTDTRQVERDKYCAQERATSPTNMEKEPEDTLQAIADTFVSELRTKNIEQGSVAPLTGSQILKRDSITSIPFHVQKAMTEPVLETVIL